MKNKFYITTSIAYVNASPHIGFALESVQADVLARYHRQKGEDVFFLTGADEHGAKIARTAQAQNKTPKQLVDEISEEFKALKGVLNLSWDDFIRTSDQKRHWPGAQKMWQALVDSGDIYKKKYKGLYCVGHEAFVTEKDLVDGICADHRKAPEVIEEENWFFKLSKYSGQIKSKIESGELKIIPESRKNEIMALMEQGLEDVSFSRPSKDLSWGVPVPGDPDQTIYVWCDALVNYISAIGYGQDDAESQKQFEKFWPADVHLIGKDILRFHAAIWPGMLLAAGLPLPKNIFVHGHITSNGQKMSKSLGNVVSPAELVEKYGVDSVRYYLLREIPAFDDGDFSEEKFVKRYNGDLSNGLGNLASRIMKMSEQHLEKINLEKVGSDFFRHYEAYMDNLEIGKALVEIWGAVSGLDSRIQEKQPFKLVKTDPDEAKREIESLVSHLYEIGIMLQPFLPAAAGKILEAIEKNRMPEPIFMRM